MAEKADKKPNGSPPPSNTNRKSKVPSYECQICGAPALHSNYGAITCYPCKMFFKRNVTITRKPLACDFNNQCEIDMNNRHVCSACRLAKCFTNGMQAELIRCPLTKKNPATISNQPEPLQISNILQSDNSTLTTDQWTLLSNLTSNFDERELLSIAEQLIVKYNSTLVNEFFININQTSEIYIRSNKDFCKLSCDDRSVYLRNIMGNVQCLITAISWYHSQIYNSQLFINVYTDLYGPNSVNIIQRIIKFIDSDILIDKLILSLFAFSNHLSLFNSSINIKSFNTHAIFHIQNIYGEITWKYLVDKYGYNQSIQRFNKLIQCLIVATTSVSDAQNIERHVHEIISSVEQTEISLVLDDLERHDENKI